LDNHISAKDFTMTLINAINATQAGTIHTLAGSGDTLVISRNIRIETTSSDVTVLVSGGGNGILNAGTIKNVLNDGISLAGNVNTLTNSGIINSGDDGVAVFGTQTTINNSGTIIGNWGVYLYSDSTTHTGTATIVNTGTIAGEVRGIAHGLEENITIRNSGLVMSASNLEAIVSFGDVSKMSLFNTGRILGDVAMGGGSDTYDGRGGTVVGDIRGDAGNDTFIAGAAAERFFGGSESDTLVFNGAGRVTMSLNNAVTGTGAAAGDFYDSIENVTGTVTGADILRGSSAGNDILGRGGADMLLGLGGGDALYGGAGADKLFGGAGVDYLYGGSGIDTLTGGGMGSDQYYCRALASAGDHITDFGNVAGNDDTLLILNTAVAGSGLGDGGLGAGRFITRADNLAQDANDRFIFRTTDRTLWYDVNGNGAGGRTLLFDLQAGATINANDIFIYSEVMIL
jgi:Ca2+-binding RTX toxin-like protein